MHGHWLCLKLCRSLQCATYNKAIKVNLLQLYKCTRTTKEWLVLVFHFVPVTVCVVSLKWNVSNFSLFSQNAWSVIGFVCSFVALSLQRRQPHFRLSPSTLEILNALEIAFPCLYFLQTMCWISVSALLVSTLTRSEPRMFGSSRFQIFWRNSTNCALLQYCNLGQTNERITWKIHAHWYLWNAWFLVHFMALSWTDFIALCLPQVTVDGPREPRTKSRFFPGMFGPLGLLPQVGHHQCYNYDQQGGFNCGAFSQADFFLNYFLSNFLSNSPFPPNLAGRLEQLKGSSTKKISIA